MNCKMKAVLFFLLHYLFLLNAFFFLLLQNKLNCKELCYEKNPVFIGDAECGCAVIVGR